VTPARNDPCPCGSGRKYKACCGRLGLRAEPELPAGDLVALVALMEAGRFVELEEGARELLIIQPESGFAWQLLGVALSGQGKASLQAVASAARYMPDDAVAHLNLGNALGRLGRMDEAQSSFARALEIRPEFAEAHSNLGDLQLEIGRPDDAAASCLRALELRPEFAEAHQNLGKALVRLGRIDEAVESCRRALTLRPEFAEAHNTLGNALLKLFQFEEAMASFRRALEIRPDFAEAAVNLSNAQRSVGRLDEAVAGYRRALLVKPDFAEAHTELGTALRLQRRAAESEASCRRALEINPDSAAALSVLADLRADAGRFDEAEELFKRIIAIDPAASDAWAGIARLRTMTPADAAWLAAAQGLVEQGLPPRSELSLRYAIGKYFDDVRDFEKAFQNYRRANELSKQCGPAHDRTRLTRNIDLIIRSHDQGWERRSRSAANPSMRPVFIVGMLRSGTSLAEQILASHPAVFGAGELTFWGAASAANIAGAAAVNASAIDISDAALVRLGDDYLRLLHGLSADALRVVDKLPTNFLFLGLIHAALPHARIIHMRRNPIDTCLSIYFQHFEAANTYVNDLEDLAHYYREYRRLMRHWRTVLPAGIMLEVPYEGLVLDLPVWSRRLLDFIGLPWDPRCLDFHQTARTVVTASRWQVRQKISTSSVERWRHYEKYIGPLKSLLESRTLNPP
jgi:tetratricopeptide (TPR) repeat protein